MGVAALKQKPKQLKTYHATMLVTRAEQWCVEAESADEARLTLRHKLPAVHESRRFTAAGGLLSFIGNTLESHRLIGIYAGRLFRGEKPAELPSQTTSKGELVINRKTANAVGLDVPEKLLAFATEVIE